MSSIMEKSKKQLPPLRCDIAQCSMGDPASAGVIILIYRVYKAIRPI